MSDRSLRGGRHACLPPGIRLYAIGDIHGCADLLVRALALIDDDIARARPSRAIHVFLGDYIDRGPDSSAALDLLIARARTHEAVFIKGNHEAILIDILRGGSAADWLRLGGATTLMSYDVAAGGPASTDQQIVREALLRAIPPSHVAFLGNLAPSFTCGDFFFTHAGVRPGVPLDRQSEGDLMWIREPFLSSDESFGKVVVHGHTPVREPDVRSYRVNIDVGAYATGRLAVLALEGDGFDFMFADRPR